MLKKKERPPIQNLKPKNMLASPKRIIVYIHIPKELGFFFNICSINSRGENVNLKSKNLLERIRYNLMPDGGLLIVYFQEYLQ